MTTLLITKFIASFCCLIFAGAAIYINLVEHPARMACGTQLAATVWAPSYKRATLMQAPLALLSFLAGVLTWWLGAGGWWLVGALLIGLVIPFTFMVIMPTNQQLLTPGRDLASAETRALLVKWAQLHAVRSVLSTAAALIFLIQLLRA